MQRELRLRSPRDFQRVRTKGRTWAHPLLVLGTVPNRLQRSRIGFVVGRAFGSAVQRNRAKRRVREAVRLQMSHIKPGWDIVFIIRAGVATVDWVELQHAVQSLLMRASLWQSQPLEKD